MRTRMYGGVRGRKTKIGGKPTFVFLLLDFSLPPNLTTLLPQYQILFKFSRSAIPYPEVLFVRLVLFRFLIAFMSVYLQCVMISIENRLYL